MVGFEMTDEIKMYSRRQLLLLSSSAPYGHTYLQYAKQDIEELFKKNKVEKVLFIPYALRDHDGYTNKVKHVLEQWNYKVEGIHTYENPITAVKSAQAIFVGGGNTFQLLKGLYDNKILDVIKKQVLEEGVPYIGSSAGTNVSTINICTTNDMPIVYPPSFDALKLVPFNINPHYLDSNPNDTHQGETREERIQQYLEVPGTGPVLGLREGATLHVEGNKATLKGIAHARLFTPNCAPKEFKIGEDLSFLFNSMDKK